MTANQVNQNYSLIKNKVKNLNLSTVCEEAKCPNLSGAGQGELLLLCSWEIPVRGHVNFVRPNTGNPKGWLDKDEPRKIAETIALMSLKYIVLTCVNRDDISDGGAQHFADTVEAIKKTEP